MDFPGRFMVSRDFFDCTTENIRSSICERFRSVLFPQKDRLLLIQGPCVFTQDHSSENIRSWEVKHTVLAENTRIWVENKRCLTQNIRPSAENIRSTAEIKRSQIFVSVLTLIVYFTDNPDLALVWVIRSGSEAIRPRPVLVRSVPFLRPLIIWASKVDISCRFVWFFVSLVVYHVWKWCSIMLAWVLHNTHS